VPHDRQATHGRAHRLHAGAQLRLPYERAFDETSPAVPIAPAAHAGSRVNDGDREPSPRVVPGSSPLLPPAMHFVVNRRARRYVLRLRNDGSLRITIPRTGSRRQAEEFVERCAAWIARQRERHAERAAAQHEAWCDGRRMWWRGRTAHLSVVPAGRGVIITLGEVATEVDASARVRESIENACRRAADRELAPRVRALAAPLRLDVARVVVRDQRTRWGSCSRYGTISLNWRLLQMPDEVRDYVIYHELMHLKRADHSRRFWRLVAGVCPWYREAEHWLRLHGAELL
jgi:predicted metal-dependent hydrolase